MVTEREAQSNAIKERLNKKFAQSGLSMNKLKKELNEKSGFEINYETLRNAIKWANPVYRVNALECPHVKKPLAE